MIILLTFDTRASFQHNNGINNYKRLLIASLNESMLLILERTKFFDTHGQAAVGLPLQVSIQHLSSFSSAGSHNSEM